MLPFVFFRGKYLFAVREISLAQSEQLTNEYILYMGLSDFFKYVFIYSLL